MGVKGSGELRFPDHENESTGQDITEEFGPDGSSNTNISLKSFYRSGDRVPNNSANTGIPESGEIKFTDFYNAEDNNLDGNLADTTGSFNFNNANLHPATNNLFDMNTSSAISGSAIFWEMEHQFTEPNPGIGGSNRQANAVAGVRIGHDQTNKRIIILLLKDGDTDNVAGGSNGAKAAYRILPYIGLENATWTVKIEYNTNSNGYDSSNSTIGTYNGPSNQTLTYSTSSTFHSVQTADTFLSIPTFTGMAANGDSLTNDGSSRQFNFIASVPGNLSNRSANTGSGPVRNGLGTTGTRLHIKAVSGSETFQTISSYWNVGLSANKGFGF